MELFVVARFRPPVMRGVGQFVGKKFHSLVKSLMAVFQILETKPAVRCEICHQADRFDPLSNSCLRCAPCLHPDQTTNAIQSSSDSFVPDRPTPALLVLCLILSIPRVIKLIGWGFSLAPVLSLLLIWSAPTLILAKSILIRTGCLPGNDKRLFDAVGLTVLETTLFLPWLYFSIPTVGWNESGGGTAWVGTVLLALASVGITSYVWYKWLQGKAG